MEAANALADMFAQLERSSADIRVRASSHLARAYGGTVDQPVRQPDAVEADEPAGWRSAQEVLAFLRKRGAKIASLKEDISGQWAAAVSSDAEGFESDSLSEDVAFVPSRSNWEVKGSS